ncbi:MAG: hypothetical protein GY810_28920 [Aureispira sp.]|nr:hypothetical protein [Aureispira sp.]
MIKIISFILCIGFLSLHSYAQTTAIPDPNFEQKLITMGIDSDGIVNGQILNSDAAAATAINLDHLNISSLSGIAAFSNLTYLSCLGNNLTAIDLSNNTALTHLNCSYNQLTSLDVSNNPKLDGLSCHHNQLRPI